METTGQIFISYCSDDAEAAQRVCTLLEGQGLACWIAPRDIPPGQEWPVAIPEAIRRSGTLVLLLSSRSRDSRQIGREVEIADRNRIRIISFRLEDVDPPAGLDYFLNNLQWVDGFGTRFDSGIDSLASTLRNTPAQTTAKLRLAAHAKPSKYWKLGRSLVFAFLVAIGMQALEYYGWFVAPDGRIFDSILTGRPKTPGAGDAAVAVLEIDDEAFQSKACFNDTSPLNPALIMSLVRETLAAGPRVVGVDVFTESDLYQAMTFRAVDPTVVWMLGDASDSLIEAATLPQWLLGAHDHIVVKPTKVLGYEPGELTERSDIHWGVPAFPPDGDFTIRRFARRIEVSADPQGSSHREGFPSWATQISQEYCRGGAYCADEAADEVYVSYNGKAPEELKMLDYFDCETGPALKLRASMAEQFKERVRGKALLIGGTFRPAGTLNDYHETPKGLLPGVMITAYAVRADIEGSGLHDVRQPWAFVLDFAIGVLVVAIFWRPLFEAATRAKRLVWLREYELRCMISFSMMLLLAFYFLIRRWPGAAYLKGFAGVSVGVLLHQIIEVFWDNPAHHGEAVTRGLG